MATKDGTGGDETSAPAKLLHMDVFLAKRKEARDAALKAKNVRTIEDDLARVTVYVSGLVALQRSLEDLVALQARLLADHLPHEIRGPYLECVEVFHAEIKMICDEINTTLTK